MRRLNVTETTKTPWNRIEERMSAAKGEEINKPYPEVKENLNIPSDDETEENNGCNEWVKAVEEGRITLSSNTISAIPKTSKEVQLFPEESTQVSRTKKIITALSNPKPNSSQTKRKNK